MVNTCKEGLSRGNRCKMTKVLQADESTQSPCSRLFHIFMDYKLWSIPSCPFAFRNVTIVSYLFQLSIFSFISHILGHSYIPVLYYNYINFIYRYKNSILFVHEASPLDLAFWGLRATWRRQDFMGEDWFAGHLQKAKHKNPDTVDILEGSPLGHDWTSKGISYQCYFFAWWIHHNLGYGAPSLWANKSDG